MDNMTPHQSIAILQKTDSVKLLLVSSNLYCFRCKLYVLMGITFYFMYMQAITVS